MNLEFNEQNTPNRTFNEKPDGAVIALIKKTGLATTTKQANVVALILIAVLCVISLVAISSMNDAAVPIQVDESMAIPPDGV